MKRVFKILLIVFIILFSIFIVTGCDDVVLPDDIEASEGLEFEKVWGGYEVTGIGTCKDSIVIIPNTYKNKKVVSIGKGAFKDCDQIITIVIPENVKTVKSEAFVACDNLTTVYIQHGVEELKTMLFYSGSGSMDEITTQYNIYYQGTTSEFKKLQSWDLLGGKSRPWFYSGFNTIIFTVYCTDGMLEYNYHELGSEPEFTAYDGSIECPYHVDNNNDHICDNCDKTLPGFSHSNNLEFTLNSDSKSYSVSGIGSCIDTDIVIPSRHNGLPVTSIGDDAFAYCYSLTSIVIPDSVTSIGDSAFIGCHSLESITVEKGNAVYHSAGNCLIETATKTLIAGCKNSVIPADGSVRSIGFAFVGCSELRSIVIPDSVTIIASFAFVDCISLTSIVIPDSVTTLGSHAFRGCINLTSINLSDNLDFIWNNTFYNCSSLTSIIIPDSATKIDWGAFEGCSSLTSIVIPDSVTRIADGAFWGCSSLESITVEKGNTTYHSSGNCLIETASKTLIAGCKNSVIPTDGSVTSIGYYAFSGCSSLTSIVIPDSVTSIGFSAFEDCSSLMSIDFKGTKAQWNAISKGSKWNNGTGNYTVHCTDGDIAK